MDYSWAENDILKQKPTGRFYEEDGLNNESATFTGTIVELIPSNIAISHSHQVVCAYSYYD